MKLKDALDNYYFHSGKTSELVRQLGIAGIAVIWLFRFEVQGTPKIPEQLFWPLMLIVVGLACDLLQYSVATWVWQVFIWHKELAGVSHEEEFLAPEKINRRALVFFWVKVAVIVCAYIFLFLYLARTIF
jgi:hypothetical protein